MGMVFNKNTFHGVRLTRRNSSYAYVKYIGGGEMRQDTKTIN